MVKVSVREWGWIAIVGGLALIAFSLPYAIGLLTSTAQFRFSGFLFAQEDMYSYIAKMRFGAWDGWALRLMYTSEPHSGGFVYLPILALGKLAALVSGQGRQVSAEALIVGYHVARIAAGALLMIVTYRFVAEFLVEVWQRRLAWAIALLGGGLGWAQIVLSPSSGGSSLPPVEFYIPEAFSILPLLGAPHLALARCLMLAGWLALFAAVAKHDWRLTIVAGSSWLGTALCVPVYIGPLGAMLTIWLLILFVTQQRPPWPEIRLAAVAGVLPLLYVGYCAWLFATNPVFRSWASQNNLPSPPVFDYLIAYGLLLVLCVPGVIHLIRSQLDSKTGLLVAWPITALALVYLPINVQRRLLEGVVVPLAILATIGVSVFLDSSWRGRWWRRLSAGAVLCLLVPSTLFLLGGAAQIASQPQSRVFHPVEEFNGLQWLAAHAAPESVILSTHQSGMMLPAYALVRTYVGHGPETVNSEAKTLIAEQFFGGGMSDQQRLALFKENAVRYVWVGSTEQALACRELGCFDPLRLGLSEVFRSGEYAIYQVTP